MNFKKKITLIGSTGLIGSHLLNAITSSDYQIVKAITRRKIYNLENKNFIKQSVQDFSDLEKMRNYGRGSSYNDLGSIWIPTSPHVPSFETPMYMVATGILGELGIFSIGVGYTTPFMTMAAPWINSDRMAERMNMLDLEGVVFRPVNYRPYYSFHKEDEVGGVQIHIIDQDKVDLIAIQFYFLQEHNILYPNKNPFEEATNGHLRMFDKALGTDKIREKVGKKFKGSDKYHLYD